SGPSIERLAAHPAALGLVARPNLFAVRISLPSLFPGGHRPQGGHPPSAPPSPRTGRTAITPARALNGALGPRCPRDSDGGDMEKNRGRLGRRGERDQPPRGRGARYYR